MQLIVSARVIVYACEFICESENLRQAKPLGHDPMQDAKRE